MLLPFYFAVVFDKTEIHVLFFLHPQIAPYLTLFINGVGWRPKFPRLMTNNQLSAATYKASNFPGFRFMNVADISCDINVCETFKLDSFK